MSKRNGKGAISVSKKTENKYKVIASNVFEDLDDAKNIYVEMVNKESIPAIERFVKEHRIQPT